MACLRPVRRSVACQGIEPRLNREQKPTFGESARKRPFQFVDKRYRRPVHRHWISGVLVVLIGWSISLSAQSVVISEVMYEPPGGSAYAEAEYLELFNAGSLPADLSGATFSAGLVFTFPTPFTVQPKARAVIARNPTLLAARYGTVPGLVPGSYTGALNNGGGALDFDKLDELIDSVNSYGGKKYLVMSKAMRRQLNALARQTVGQGVYNVSTNNLGVMVHHYQECQILTVDRDAQGLEVLGYGEAGGTSSIYCCTFGDQAVTGLQGPFQGRYGISVRDLGEVPDAPVFRTRIDWYVGFGVMHP
ncbi:MAG: hypothetical protein RI896_535, partial [Pseudomonadota bacterium]